ncbi:alpha-tocopherol transfer protein-like [Wyeomyia smithii]|uniref:alpha-tocopherol transfer protein-like n=1 Tax=Wyeomyia smithii TaxID=174621 RepID=UPI002467FBBE|nr:alpha-tocopherol transfer protein-like [Wyeomyia smithii]
MSIRVDENNHPYIELGNGFTIRFNRAAYEEDKRLREKATVSKETEAALAEFRRLAESKPRFNLVVDQTNWTVMVHLLCYENDARKAFGMLEYGYSLLSREPVYVMPYSRIRHVYEEGFIRYLPECDDEKVVIIIIEMGGRWDPSRIPITEFVSAIRISGILTMVLPNAQKHGYRIIYDVEGLSMRQIAHISPKVSSVLFDMMENCTPIVTKGMHTVNNGVMYNVLFAIFKQFMSKEMRDKCYIHGKDWQSLTKFINPRCLPPKYGGTSTAPDCDGKLMAKYLENYQGYVEEYNSFGYTGPPVPK